MSANMARGLLYITANADSRLPGGDPYMPPSIATPAPKSAPQRPTPPRAMVGVAPAASLSTPAPVVAAPMSVPPVSMRVPPPVFAAPQPAPMPLPFAVAATPLPIVNPFLPTVAAAPVQIAPADMAALDIAALELAATAIAPVLAAPPPAPAPVAAVALPPIRPRGRSFTWEDFRMSPDPIAIEKMKPEAQLRRAKLTRYVKAIVGGCAALCLVALVRSAVASESDTSVPAATTESASAHNQARQKVVAPKVLVTQAEEVVAVAPTPTKAAAKAPAKSRGRR